MKVSDTLEPWSQSGFEAMLSRIRAKFEAAGLDSSKMRHVLGHDGPLNRYSFEVPS